MSNRPAWTPDELAMISYLAWRLAEHDDVPDEELTRFVWIASALHAWQTHVALRRADNQGDDMADPDELDARRRIVLSITDPDDRAAVLAIFDRVDWRRHHEALTSSDDEVDT